MLALNEPETSIHPNLYEPLARLIVAAAFQTITNLDYSTF